MGSFTGSRPSGGNSGFMAAMARAVDKTDLATMLPQSMFARKLASIENKFGARSPEDKQAVKAVLIVYFAAHGTSPYTHWVSYPHNIEALGVELPTNDVVAIIGQDLIKRFMAVWSEDAIAAYKEFPKFKQLMRERVQKAGLSEEEGYLAIDYVGKDGKLDSGSAAVRSQAKAHLLSQRSHAREDADEVTRRGYAVAREVSGVSTRGADPFA